MPEFNETSLGGITIGGCARPQQKHLETTLFAPGDVAFNAYKARRGTLEKVVVKKAKLLCTRKIAGLQRVLYTDTLNGLWNEDELVDFATAKALAMQYQYDLMDELDGQIRC